MYNDLGDNDMNYLYWNDLKLRTIILLKLAEKYTFYYFTLFNSQGTLSLFSNHSKFYKYLSSNLIFNNSNFLKINSKFNITL
jgi:hypothetical protein